VVRVVRRAALCGLLATCLSACSSGPITVGLVSGTDAEYEATLVAARSWNEVCGRPLINVRREAVWPDVPVYFQKSEIAPGVFGLCHWTDSTFEGHGADWVRVDASSPCPLAATLAHEFGHALGIKEHTKTGLMSNKLPCSAPYFTTDGSRLLPGLITQADCDSLAF